MTANVVHGGTRSGPPLRVDFSTNANALGPDPLVVDALRAVDPTAYPDPAYSGLREELAARHGRHPDEVVVGAGASELVHRVVADGARAGHRPVLVWEPTFSEYAHAAAVARLPAVVAEDADAYLDLLPGAGVAFLCQPNSPDGRIRDAAVTTTIGEASRRAGVPVVCDLAYAPLAEDAVPVPPGAWELHSPNKSHGTTGVRAAYLLAPRDPATRLRARAPSWVLSVHGEAFLRVTAGEAAERWVASTRPRLWRWRDGIAAALAERGLPVHPGRANYLLADVGVLGGATPVTRALADRGIGVRDATSFGLPDCLRLRAHTPSALDALLTALDDCPTRLLEVP